MHILNASHLDADALTQIAFLAKSSWNYPTEWMEEWKTELTITAEMIEQGMGRVAWEDGSRIGFYLLRTRNSGLHLEHLWILPGHQRRGIGKLLLADACNLAREKGFDGLHIESDPNAEGFYTKLGARRIGSIRSIICGISRETPRLFLPSLNTDVRSWRI
jgi:GNAT superfamily N-acetyltransferase